MLEMRLWTILASLPVMAVGLSIWRYGQWAGSLGPGDADWCGDGTVQGLEALLSYALSLFFFAASVIVLFLGNVSFRRRVWAVIRAVVSRL
jgi:hypothetical protein